MLWGGEFAASFDLTGPRGEVLPPRTPQPHPQQPQEPPAKRPTRERRAEEVAAAKKKRKELKFEGRWNQGGRGCDDTFVLLKPAEVDRMIQEYETEVYGAPFAESEKPSDTQVSACRGRIIADDNPTPCFGLVGPFGDRAEMGMANAGDIEIDGVKTRRRYKGPDDHPRWNGCWRIFGSCMKVCKASPQGPLDAYEKNILELYIRLPRFSVY